VTDTELDEILDKWAAPAAPSSLRATVRAEAGSCTRRRVRPGVWALASVAAVLLVGVQAPPQKVTLLSPAARIPFTVDSEFFYSPEDGSTAVTMYSSSYSRDAREIFLYKSMPGDPWATAMLRVLDFGAALLRPIQEYSLALTVPPQEIQRARELVRVADCVGANCKPLSYWTIGSRSELLRSGCELGAVSGHETILGYPTAAIRRSIAPKRRITVWMAPALGCFPLKSLVEEQQADGTFRAIRGRRALKIAATRNRLFVKVCDYAARRVTNAARGSFSWNMGQRAADESKTRQPYP